MANTLQFKLSEVVTICNALHTARGQYKQDEKTCRDNGLHRLADHFKQQTLDAGDVIERIQKEIGL